MDRARVGVAGAGGSASRRAWLARSLAVCAAALAVGAAAVQAAPATARTGSAPQIVFPIVGPLIAWHDDFGEPRPIGNEEGNDIGVTPHTPVVAAASGTVHLADWNGAGWSIELHAENGDVYTYIHLGLNGRRASAYVPGLVDGAHVVQGEQIAWSGYSGNATRAFPHVEFQYHPHGGTAVSPFQLLQAAPRLLFAAPRGEPAAAGAADAAGATMQLDLVGRVAWVAAGDGRGVLRLVVRSCSMPGSRPSRPGRAITLGVAPGVAVLRGGVAVPFARLRPGDRVVVRTAPFAPSIASQTGAPGALTAASVRATPNA